MMMDRIIVLLLYMISWFYGTVYSDEENGVIRELWTNIQGDSIQNLLADSRFPHRPTRINILNNFDAPTDDDKNYAQRIKGYFLAPEDGEYKFYSSCDGSCEIFLGLDGMEGENNRIISQHKSTKRNEYMRFPEQASHAIALEKDQLYYLEAINKHSSGEENLSVGVELPDGQKLFPIPKEYLRKSKGTSNSEGDKNESSTSTVITPRKSRSRSHKKTERNVHMTYETRHKYPDKKDYYMNSTNTASAYETKNQHAHDGAFMISYSEKENSDDKTNTKLKAIEKNKVSDIDTDEDKALDENDTIEPGVNIFTESKTALATSTPKDYRVEKNSESDGEVALGTRRETTGRLEENSENSSSETKTSYSDDKTSGENNSNNEKDTRVIEANFNNLRKPLAHVLAQHMKTSHIDVIMPGGNSMKLGNGENEEDSSGENFLNERHISSNNTLDSKSTSASHVDNTMKKAKTMRKRPKVESNLKPGVLSTRNYASPDGGEAPPEGSETMHSAGLTYHNPELAPSAEEHHEPPPPPNQGNGLHFTGAVAMVPALIHHDKKVFDYDTGHMSGGGTHIEPLVPVHSVPIPPDTHLAHNKDAHELIGVGGLGHTDPLPLMGQELRGGFDTAQHAIDPHHLPEIHAPLPDAHINPYNMMQSNTKELALLAPPTPSPPPPPPPVKPDIIKVEFVPEEATVEAVNKSKISTKAAKKAGTVRVQFIPGDSSSVEKSVRQENAFTRNKEKAQKESSDKESTPEIQTSKTKTQTSSDSEKTSNPSKEQKQGEDFPTISELNQQQQQQQQQPEKQSAEENQGKTSTEETTQISNGNEPTLTQQTVSGKTKSKNGYEANPSLPFLDKNKAPPAIEGSSSSPPSSSMGAPSSSMGAPSSYGASSNSGSFPSSSGSPSTNDMSSFQGGASSPSIPGGMDGGSMEEKIDPPMTTLGQQYPDAVGQDVKAAVASDQKTVANSEDHVYFEGPGGAAAPPVIPMSPQSTGQPPSPALPTEHPEGPPSQQPVNGNSQNAAAINPVATHLMDALEQKTVSPEEALQMMNDFVSGNQDMSKAAKNMEGMLGQISSKRQPKKPTDSMDPMTGSMTPPLPQLGPPMPSLMGQQQMPQMSGSSLNDPMNPSTMTQLPALPNMAIGNPNDDEHKFIGDPSMINPNMNSGFVNPSFPKLPTENTVFTGGIQSATTASQRDEQHTSQFIGTPTTVNSRQPSREFEAQNAQHNTHNMVMEPLHSNYDGFSNPTFRKAPQPPPFEVGTALIDKFENHEIPSQSDRGLSSEKLHEGHEETDNSLIQNTETLPSIDVPNTVSAVEEKLPPPTLMDANNQPVHQESNDLAGYTAPASDVNYNDNNEAELPEGHIVPNYPVESSVGYTTQDIPNFSRKFATPHVSGGGGRNALSSANIKAVTGIAQPLAPIKPPNLLRSRPKTQTISSKLKEQTGTRKQNTLAQLYEDSIFPEDYTDIVSLQGSLQGKTLTNFDKTEPAIVRSTKPQRPHYHQMVKTSYPMEGSVLGGPMGTVIGGGLVRSKVPGSRESKQHRISRQRKRRSKRRIKKRKKKKQQKNKHRKRKLSYKKKVSRVRREIYYPNPKIEPPGYLLSKFSKSVNSFNRNEIFRKSANEEQTDNKIVIQNPARKENLERISTNENSNILNKFRHANFRNTLNNRRASHYKNVMDPNVKAFLDKTSLTQFSSHPKVFHLIRSGGKTFFKRNDSLSSMASDEEKYSNDDAIFRKLKENKLAGKELNKRKNENNSEQTEMQIKQNAEYLDYVKKNRKMVDIPIIRSKDGQQAKITEYKQENSSSENISDGISDDNKIDDQKNQKLVKDEGIITHMYLDSNNTKNGVNDLFPENSDWADIKPIGDDNEKESEKSKGKESENKKDEKASDKLEKEPKKESEKLQSSDEKEASDKKVEKESDKESEKVSDKVNSQKEEKLISVKKPEQKNANSNPDKLKNESEENAKVTDKETQTVTAIPLPDNKPSDDKKPTDKTKKKPSKILKPPTLKNTTQSVTSKNSSVSALQNQIANTLAELSDFTPETNKAHSSGIPVSTTEGVKSLQNSQIQNYLTISDSSKPQSNPDDTQTGQDLNSVLATNDQTQYSKAVTEESLNMEGFDEGNVISTPHAFETEQTSDFDANDRTTFKTLVTELKDVLHNLHDEKHDRKSNNIKENSVLFGPPDLPRYEAVSRGEILNAFENVGKPVVGNHAVDIENFSQDVWEPGVRTLGDSFSTGGLSYKRARVPQPKRKHHHRHSKKS